MFTGIDHPGIHVTWWPEELSPENSPRVSLHCSYRQNIVDLPAYTDYAMPTVHFIIPMTSYHNTHDIIPTHDISSTVTARESSQKLCLFSSSNSARILPLAWATWLGSPLCTETLLLGTSSWHTTSTARFEPLLLSSSYLSLPPPPSTPSIKWWLKSDSISASYQAVLMHSHWRLLTCCASAIL